MAVIFTKNSKIRDPPTAMNTKIAPSLRAAALAAALFVVPAVFAANPDRPAEALAANGAVRIDSAGPYVEVGTYRVQVLAKLGSPSATLPDGTLLYSGYGIEDSSARATLVVRFADGRVSQLMLANSDAVVALRTRFRHASEKIDVASK